MREQSRNETIQSEVLLGEKDDYQFVGIRPPLNEDEIKALVSSDLIKKPELVVEVSGDTEPDCSLMATGQDLIRSRSIAFHIAVELRRMREGEVRNNLIPVPLTDDHSTPFNP